MDIECTNLTDRAYLAQKNINLIFIQAKKDKRMLTRREWELVSYHSNVAERAKLRLRVLLKGSK